MEHAEAEGDPGLDELLRAEEVHQRFPLLIARTHLRSKERRLHRVSERDAEVLGAAAVARVGYHQREVLYAIWFLGAFPKPMSGCINTDRCKEILNTYFSAFCAVYNLFV